MYALIISVRFVQKVMKLIQQMTGKFKREAEYANI